MVLRLLPSNRLPQKGFDLHLFLLNRFDVKYVKYA